MEIIGKWSNDILYAPYSHSDEVLVFLPNGSGVLEVYNLSLCWYETFTYWVKGNAVNIIGGSYYHYDFHKHRIEKLPARLNFSGQFSLGAGINVYGGAIDILKFENWSYNTIPDRYGRVPSFEPLAYTPPSFQEWVHDD